MRPFALIGLAGVAVLSSWLWAGCSPVGSSSHALFDTVMDAGMDAGTGAGCDGGCEGTCEFRTGVGLTQLVSMGCSDGCGCPATHTSGACVARADGCMSEALLNQLGDPDFRKREQAQAKIAACCTDSNYLSWLQSAPQNQSPDGEITWRLTEATRLCGLAVDPCQAVDGGTLVSQEQNCAYSYDGLGIQEEPSMHCEPLLTTFQQIYLATCAATNVALVNAFPCHGDAHCPRAGTIAAFQHRTLGNVSYETMEACLAAGPDPAVIQALVDMCKSTGLRETIHITVDACKQGDELNGTCL